MERRRERARIDVAPMRAAMTRMQIPFRRIRRDFDNLLVTTGGRFGREFSIGVRGARVGGFIGFLTDPRGWEHLRPEIPEAVVYAFVRPAGHALYRRLVSRKGSLFRTVARRSTYEGVRFDLFPGEEAAIVRHRTMRGRPDEILVLAACDFFMTSFRAFWAADFLDRVLRLKRARKAKR